MRAQKFSKPHSLYTGKKLESFSSTEGRGRNFSKSQSLHNYEEGARNFFKSHGLYGGELKFFRWERQRGEEDVLLVGCTRKFQIVEGGRNEGRGLREDMKHVKMLVSGHF